MSVAEPLDFQPYLQSICSEYKYWWTHYTLMSVVGQPSSEEEDISSPFDFGQVVQRLQPEPREKEEELRTERLSVLEGLRKYAREHVLLVGAPGLGKSTALRRLLLEEARQAIAGLESSSPNEAINITIPVLIELRYLQSQTDVIERIEAFFYQHDPNLQLNKATLKIWLHQGRLLLLFDGLNEISSEQARQRVRGFRQDYRKTPMIFTTRDVSLGGNLGINKFLEMQPLTQKQMGDFVQGYLPEQGEQLLRQLHNRLLQLGQTSLLLWMLCSLFKHTGNVPANLGLVFRHFTQGYERHLIEDVPVSADSRRWWSRLLQYLAFVMMQGEIPTEFRAAIPRGEAEIILAEFLQGKVAYPDDLVLRCLDDLLKYHLIQVGSGDQIEFRHQLLQEYYAAEYLLQRLPSLRNGELKDDYLNYLKWTEPLILMLALEDRESQAMGVVNLALEVDLKLGARLAGAVSPEFQVQTVSLIDELNIPQPLKVELLGSTRSDEAVSFLCGQLNDEDSYVRGSAPKALGNIGSESAIN
ncbi:MAG: NACHT domain-containing protein [Xenococcaceae cyanobacterium]